MVQQMFCAWDNSNLDILMTYMYLDNDSVCRQIDTPRQCCCTHHDLDVSIPEASLHHGPILTQHTGVVS